MRYLKLFSKICLGALLAALFVSGAAALHAEYPSEQLPASQRRGGIWGAYHIHSIASDGRGDLSEIARAAAKAGLSFVIVTDHNLPRVSPPRYQNGVLVISGTELSTHMGHLVALGVPDGLQSVDYQNPVAWVRRRGGQAFLAHPVQPRMPWSNWEVAEEATGLELYSADTMLREAQQHPFSRLLPAAAMYLFNPVHALYSLVAAQPDATSRLLSLSQKAPKVSLCSVDAHGMPPYELVFRLMALKLPGAAELPKDPQVAADRVMSALASGELQCVFRPLGDADDFLLSALAPGRRAKVGDTLEVKLNEEEWPHAEVRLSGPARAVEGGRRIELLEPGPVAVEVWRDAPGLFWGSVKKPWIVLSPFLVQPAAP